MSGNVYTKLRDELLPGKKVVEDSRSQLMRAGLPSGDRMVELLADLNDAYKALDSFLYEQDKRTRVAETAFK